MKTGKKLISIFLVLASLIGIIPVSAPAAEAAGLSGSSTSTGSSSGVTITQTAEWSSPVPGQTRAIVTLEVTSEPRMQTPNDVVILIDRSGLQPLDEHKNMAFQLVDILSAVPGTRFALVSYASTAQKLLDFTSNYEQVKSAIRGITTGANNNPYSGLQEAQKLLRTASQKSCVVFLSNGLFNMNTGKARELMKTLSANVPIYTLYSDLLDYQADTRMREVALEITDSPLYTDLVVTARLDTGNFLPYGFVREDGVVTFSRPSFRMGQSFKVSFAGTLKDRTMFDDISVARKASVTAADLSVETGGVFLNRNGHTVTYDGNGADDTAECPPPRGQQLL